MLHSQMDEIFRFKIGNSNKVVLLTIQTNGWRFHRISVDEQLFEIH